MTTSEKRQPSCKERWRSEKNGRMADIRKLWQSYQDDPEAEVDDLGNLFEYGLGFDYVNRDTFDDQPRGYWRWQFSWGGPSDEVRFYADGPDATTPDKIEYVFMDWFDGQARPMTGRDLDLMRDLWSWFQDAGCIESEYRKNEED